MTPKPAPTRTRSAPKRPRAARSTRWSFRSPSTSTRSASTSAVTSRTSAGWSTAAWWSSRSARPTRRRPPRPSPTWPPTPAQSNEDATEWSFTLKDGPKWQDGQPITCEDFKYGVSRTFATDVITGGPNYIIGYLDVPEDADGTPVYKGPYTGEGQAEFDKAVDLRRQHHHLPVQEAVAGLPAGDRVAAGVRPLPGRPGQGRQVRPRGLLQRSVHARRRVERGLGRHATSATRSGTAPRTPTARRTRTRSCSRSVSRPRSSSTGSSPTRATTQTRSRPAA